MAAAESPETGFEEITLRATLNNKDHTSPNRTSEAFAGRKAISRRQLTGQCALIFGRGGQEHG